MKKYIRTKNEIYEIIGSIGHTIFPSQYQNRYKDISIIMDEAIIEADTIEELCDEFVAVNDSMDLPILDSFENICLLLTTKKHKNDDVYGAIWTDKGLIYVAKMNRKGELELLWD